MPIDTICCPEDVDTFLAVTKIKPNIEKPRKMTTKEIQKLGNELEDVLDNDIAAECLTNFWNIGIQRQLLETQKSFLLEQQRILDGRREGR